MKTALELEIFELNDRRGGPFAPFHAQFTTEEEKWKEGGRVKISSSSLALLLPATSPLSVERRFAARATVEGKNQRTQSARFLDGSKQDIYFASSAHNNDNNNNNVFSAK